MSKIRSINLQKDPMYMKQQSLIKKLKEKDLQRKRQIRTKRLSPTFKKQELTIQIFDPLSTQLATYRDQTSYKKITQNSKAKDALKKYITQQQRKLKCLRVQRPVITFNQKQNSTQRRTRSLKLHIAISKDADQPFNKQIEIPKVEQIFKDQQKQILIYQNQTLSKKIHKAISSLDNKIIKSKAYSTLDGDSRKQSKTFKFLGFKNNQEDDMDIDDIIQKKLQKSQALQKRFYDQRNNSSKQVLQGGSINDGMSFLLTFFGKIKQRIPLQGIKKTQTIKSGNKKIRVTPASSLLYQMNKLTKQREKKQDQLSTLLKSSFQNRESILNQKSIFYESQGSNLDLSPSNQMKLRSLMDKKLNHRLQLSKQQINKFIALMQYIKNQYHVVLNDTILNILKEVRSFLMSGKTMKMKDFDQIMEHQDIQQLKPFPNGQIMHKLKQIMI